MLQDLYGLSPLLFGLVFAAATLGYGLGTLLAARLVVRIGIDRTIVCGGVALAVGGLAMAAAIALGALARRAGGTDGALSLRFGLAMPQSMAGALMRFRARGRRLSPSALAAGDRVRDWHRGGQMFGSSALPLAAIVAAMGVLALALALFRRSMGSVH